MAGNGKSDADLVANSTANQLQSEGPSQPDLKAKEEELSRFVSAPPSN